MGKRKMDHSNRSEPAKRSKNHQGNPGNNVDMNLQAEKDAAFQRDLDNSRVPNGVIVECPLISVKPLSTLFENMKSHPLSKDIEIYMTAVGCEIRGGDNITFCRTIVEWDTLFTNPIFPQDPKWELLITVDGERISEILKIYESADRVVWRVTQDKIEIWYMNYEPESSSFVPIDTRFAPLCLPDINMKLHKGLTFSFPGDVFDKQIKLWEQASPYITMTIVRESNGVFLEMEGVTKKDNHQQVRYRLRDCDHLLAPPDTLEPIRHTKHVYSKGLKQFAALYKIQEKSTIYFVFESLYITAHQYWDLPTKAGDAENGDGAQPKQKSILTSFVIAQNSQSDTDLDIAVLEEPAEDEEAEINGVLNDLEADDVAV